MDAIDIKGPKGILYLRLFLDNKRLMPPIKAPMKLLEKSIKGIAFHPSQAPTMASSLISPPPIPSLFVTHLYVMAIMNKNPPPINIPRMESIQYAIGIKNEAHMPAKIPGMDKISGMI